MNCTGISRKELRIHIPEGIKDPELPDNNEEINDDHTLGNTWHPNYWK